MKNLKPTGSRVLVKLDDVEEKSKGGILLPNNKRKHGGGIVIEVGSKVTLVAIGMHVLTEKFKGHPINDNEEGMFVIINEEDIEAIIED